MKKRSSSFINMFLALAVVTLAASASLGFVYQLTKEPIAKAKLEKQKKAIREVFAQFDNDPIAAQIKVAVPYKKDSLTFFSLQYENEFVGYAVKSFSSKGYSGNISIMVGIDATGKVTKYEVLSHAETPGLGSKISDDKFKNQFVGINQAVKVSKDGGSIDAISGATISTRAICEAVNTALETWRVHQKNNN